MVKKVKRKNKEKSLDEDMKNSLFSDRLNQLSKQDGLIDFDSGKLNLDIDGKKQVTLSTEPEVLLSMLEDLNKSKLEVESQKELAENYLDIAGVIIVALDLHGKITLLNKEGYNILGYSSGKLLGKNWFDTCIPKKERSNLLRVFKEEILPSKKKGFFEYENYVLTKSGKERLILWKNSLIKNKLGKVIGTLSSGEDITDKKQIQEELINERNLLFHSIESGGIMVVSYNLDGNLLLVNNDFLKITNYQRGEFNTIQKFKKIIFPSKIVKIQLEKAINWVMRGGMVKELVIPLFLKKGNTLLVSMNIAPVKNSGKKIMAYTFFIRDLTKIFELEKQIRYWAANGFTQVRKDDSGVVIEDKSEIESSDDLKKAKIFKDKSSLNRRKKRKHE
jgi:PAS domain S-box-containing protein